MHVGSGNPLHTRTSVLPKISPSKSNVSIFTSESFPAITIKPAVEPRTVQVSDNYLVYDGKGNVFVPQEEVLEIPRKGKRKSVYEQDCNTQAIPRPRNSFICARSVLQPLARNLTNLQMSGVLSDVS